jgi:DMSO/TMAO reductase YedYZ molybdopterin-dependent catalytic subunit
MFGFDRDPYLQSEEPPTPASVEDSVIISPDTRRENRIPPRQSRTRKWPVLDASGPPVIDMATWKLEINGLVEHPVSWTWEEFRKLPRTKVFADMHCVTRWSRLGNVWEGVSTAEALRHAGVKPNAHFVMAYGYDRGWSTNIPLDEFLLEDCLFADTHDGQPINVDHGGPLRLIVPRLYAWKSAKWIRGVELIEKDRPGFWERGGYHMHGDPWQEERFRDNW